VTLAPVSAGGVVPDRLPFELSGRASLVIRRVPLWQGHHNWQMITCQTTIQLFRQNTVRVSNQTSCMKAQMDSKKTNPDGKPKRGRGRPATGRMPIRWYRMHTTDFDLVQAAADESGMTIADYTRSTLMTRSREVLK